MSQTAEKRGGLPAMLKDAAFVWEDPLDLEGELTEDERMVRNTTRGFAKIISCRALPRHTATRNMTPAFLQRWASWTARRDAPGRIWRRGAFNVAYGLIAREVERVDSGYRSSMWVQSALVMHPIHAYGTAGAEEEISAQARERRTARLLRFDRARSRLRSRLHEDARRQSRRRLSLNGAKTWITISPVRRSRAGVGEGDDDRIRGFFVERGTKGFSTPKIEGKFSLRAFAHGRDRAGRLFRARREHVPRM